MKTFIRTLWGNDDKPQWKTEHQRLQLQDELNEWGFYVLTGQGDSLDVYAIQHDEPMDIKYFKILLDKIMFRWYNIKEKNKCEQL